ncbi:RCC1/BLIP-II [Abortiporus biennis]|nr:RCC1/BLIP-II [Abortiporus biennis]
MKTISDIPVEVFLDNLLPYLSVPDLLRLGTTSHAFQRLTSDETFWHRKLQEDYNFSGSETARSTGWKFIYKRLANPEVYVWGEAANGRLGMPQLPRSSLHQAGVPFPVHLRIPGVRIVSLIAGGMSFHAIDAKGHVYVWGSLDGSTFALGVEGFSEPGRSTSVPLRLDLPATIRSISCGRLHSAALDSTSTVWNFSSWGRPFRIHSPLLDKSSPETTPIQVECGWGFTSILTQSSDVLVYWPGSGSMLAAIQARKQSFDQNDYDSRAIPVHGVIPCHVWDLEGIDPFRLPPIPIEQLPDLLGTGLSEDDRTEETRLIRIAGMDNNLIGLTNKGHVLRYSMLTDEAMYTHGRWQYLPWFSEVEKVKQDRLFSGENDDHLDPPKTMLITHISAQFQTFIAYSTGPQSVVLMCKYPTDVPNPPPVDDVKPTLIPKLQYQSVISVVLGDYHYGALTSDGRLLTWGSFSNGALGLGDPVNLEPGEPGGFQTEQHRQIVLNSQRGWMPVKPRDVTVPTEVRFDHGLERKRKTYCFAATAAGWHMGALVIDLEVCLLLLLLQIC